MGDSAKQPAPASAARELCFRCGMCCNGVIFADVRFTDAQKAKRLEERGVHSCPGTARGQTSFRLAQPCAAYDGQRCTVYTERPDYCRQFECHLLQCLNAGTVTSDFAFRRVAAARATVKSAEELLRSFENGPAQGPLARRFHRAMRQAQKDPERAGERVSKLMHVMHRLNLLLGRWFYPASQGR